MTMKILGKDEFGPTRMGTRQLFLLTLAALWVLMLVTAPYAVDYRALSPIGALIVILTIYPFATKLPRLLKSIRASYRRANVLAVLLLIQGINFSQPSPLPVWDIAINNLTMLGNTHAWIAAFDLNLNRGLAGITPMFYRLVVPQAPVSLVVVPNMQTNTLEAQAILSGQHLFPFAAHPAVLHTLPDHTLNIQHLIFLSDNSNAFVQFSDILLPALQVGCTANCVTNMQLEINPEYAAKVAIDGLSLTTTILKVPRILGTSVNILKTASQMLLSPEWNTKLLTMSSGTMTLGGSEFTWQSNSVQVYSGSILGGHWSISETKHVVINQTFAPSVPPRYEHWTFNPPAVSLPPVQPNIQAPIINPVPAQPNIRPPVINPFPVQPNIQPPVINPFPVQPNIQPPVINPFPVLPIYQPPVINPLPVQPNIQPPILNPVPVLPIYQPPITDH